MGVVAKHHTAWAVCDVHRKKLYSDRKRARAVAKTVSVVYKVRKVAYPCDVVPGMWHVGGLPDPVKNGVLTRDEYYGRAS